MVNKYISALESHYHKGSFDLQGKSNVILSEIRSTIINQVAVWPDTLNDIGTKVSQSLNLEKYPEANKVVSSKNIAMLRIEPLKWWVVSPGGIEYQDLIDPSISILKSLEEYIDLSDKSSFLDLSHSRTHVRILGQDSTTLLNRHLPIDLRENSFPMNSVATTSFHHCSVTLWRSVEGYELFLPRAFALSLWEILIETASQFGYEIK